jgi:hypothetical protein
MKNIIVAVFAALALVACSAQETDKPVVAQAPACEVSAQDERNIAADNRFQFRSIAGEAARKFVVATGGADAPFLKDIELVQVFLGVYPERVVVSAYDRNGCKLGGAILTEESVFGKIA